MNGDDLLRDPVDDAGSIRERAEAILDGSGFDDSRNILTRVFERLWTAIGSAVDWLVAGSGILGLLVLAAGLTAALTLLIVAVNALRRARGARVSRDHSSGGSVTVFGEPVSARELETEATQAEMEGRWKEAMLAHFRLAVSRLVDVGVLSDLAGRTTGEYRDEMATSDPASSEVFVVASRRFERAYYGDQTVTAADLDSMKRDRFALEGTAMATR